MNKEGKGGGSFSKVIVGLIVLLNTIFAVAVLYTFTKTGTEPIVLIGAWFGFTTVELWQLASIKRTEVREEITKNYEEEF